MLASGRFFGLSRCRLLPLAASDAGGVLSEASKDGGTPARPPQVVQKRNSSYIGSGYVQDMKNLTDFEVFKSPPEWKYVQRLMPLELVPEVTPKPIYPSGWVPPNKELADKQPYFVERTKNHMLPVYMKILERGLRKYTVIRRIHGDIWQLEKDLRKFLNEKTNGKCPDSRVHELTCQILLRQEHVINTQRFLYSKGF